MNSNNKPLRVIQWATGTVGKLNIITCQENPAFELVGCYVYSADKAGQDAGVIAGIDPVGIETTNNIDDILKLDADVVIYAPLYDDVDEICRILESGKNLVTPVGYTAIRDDSVKERIEQACRKGKTSFHGSGIHPGFAGDRLPLVLSALSRRIDKVTVYEIVDMSNANESWELITAMGFDMPAEEASRTQPPYLDQMSKTFFESIELVARGLGIEIEEFEKQHEFAVAREEIRIPLELGGKKENVIHKGHVAGQHFSYLGKIGGKAVIDFQTYWKMTKELDPDWPFDDALAYYVIIDGEPPLRLDFTCGVEKGSFPYGLTCTAMNCMNSAAMIVKASPGIHTQLDLPLITAHNAVNLDR
jgi:hypothetical protein